MDLIIEITITFGRVIQKLKQVRESEEGDRKFRNENIKLEENLSIRNADKC